MVEPENQFPIEKYRELYELSKDILGEEDRRISLIEDKANKYVQSVSIMIGGFAFFANSALSQLSKASDQILSLLILSATGAELALLAITIYFLMKILKPRGYKVRTIDIDFFDKNDLPAIYRASSVMNREALDANRTSNNSKAKYLSYCHRLIIAAMAVFIPIIILYTLLTFRYNQSSPKNKEAQMNQQQKENPAAPPSTPSTVPSTVPVPNTQPTPYETVIKSEPSHITKRD